MHDARALGRRNSQAPLEGARTLTVWFAIRRGRSRGYARAMVSTPSHGPEEAPSPDALWREHILAIEAQTLDDLSRTGASEVVFVRQARTTEASVLLDALEARASRASSPRA